MKPSIHVVFIYFLQYSSYKVCVHYPNQLVFTAVRSSDMINIKHLSLQFLDGNKTTKFFMT